MQCRKTPQVPEGFRQKHTFGKHMLRAVLQEMDWPKIKGVPWLVLCRAGHLQTPLIRNPTFTPRVILSGEAVPAVGPVAFVIADGSHVRHPGD